MAIQYEEPTVSKALPIILSDLLEYGEETDSRNGRVMELLNPQITITEPQQREILSLNRKANVFAQIAETMWILAGRNDIEWLSAYLPRAKDYSDDGETWRGGYGPRLRDWTLFNGDRLDQLAHVVDTLRKDPLSRRAVISIYSPDQDIPAGKDVPCNDFLQFQSRLGKLHLTVTVRSNDAMWGWSGINAFEWSTLQEIVARMLGIRVGHLTFNIGNLHLYEAHWERARRITYEDPSGYLLKRVTFDPDGMVASVGDLDLLIERWFIWEQMCRSGAVDTDLLDDFEEPLFKSWAAAIAYYWTGDPVWQSYFHGTALAVAVARTPASVFPKPVQRPHDPVVGAGPTYALREPSQGFYEFARGLHATKHASYGDSWKKRGEKMSILANIARKVDRLGEGDEYDSAADTVLDLWIYLAKYLCWLDDMESGPETVDPVLERSLLETQDFSTERKVLDLTFMDISLDFDYYVDNLDALSEEQKRGFVTDLMVKVAPIARDLWVAEDDYRGADHE